MPPFATHIPSVRPSVRDNFKHCENGGDYGEEVTTGLLRDPPSTFYDHPFPKLGAHNPQSKIASQIAAKRWFALTA